MKKESGQDKIVKAFMELCVQKGFDQLNVSDICRSASVNRGTFYLYYLDKYDLQEKLESTIINELEIILVKNDRSQDNELFSIETVIEALYYLKANIKLVKAIVGKNDDSKMVGRFKLIIASLVKQKAKQSEFMNDKFIEHANIYHREVLTSSIVSIILLWIKRDAKESPEQIALLLRKNRDLFI